MSTVNSAGTGADTAAPDRHYENQKLVATPASGNADSCIAAAPASGSQGLDYDSVFFLWQTGPRGGQVLAIGLNIPVYVARMVGREGGRQLHDEVSAKRLRAGNAIAEVASSADLAEVASSADLAGDVTVGVTSLADPVSVVTTGVAFREECGDSVMVLSGSVCDYDEYLYDGHYDIKTDYFGYADPGDYDAYPSVYGFVGPDNYELYHDLHGSDGCVWLCWAG